jgi:hypothetical protein
MHRTAVVSALVAFFISSPACTETASAIEQADIRMEVLVDGRPARELPARGKRYVLALRNSEYSVRLSNDTGKRVAVALAIDGLNSVDAKHTAAVDATKWVLGPYESIVVQGWQIGPERARRFFFTTEERSYGEWLGDTRNLGVISAVAFVERRYAAAPPRRSYPAARRESLRRDAAAYDSFSSDAAPPGSQRSEARVEAPAAASAKSGGGETARGDARGDARAPRAKRGPGGTAEREAHAATGIGRRVENDVSWVEFDLDPRPVARLTLRYGFREELVALRVLPRRDRPLSRRERASGFAPDPGYVR